MCFETECLTAIQLRSLILAPIKNAYATILVMNSNLGPILSHFRNIAGFLLRRAIPPYSTQILGCSAWTIADVVALRSEDPMLIIRVISFELTQHIRPRSSTSQTDGRTDGRTTCDSNTALRRFALCASRGNNPRYRLSNDNCPHVDVSQLDD